MIRAVLMHPEASSSQRVAIYARVAHQGQESELQRQVQRCQAYARERGWQVVHIAREVDWGHGSLLSRKVLASLLLLPKGEIDLLLLLSPACLSPREGCRVLLQQSVAAAGLWLVYVQDDEQEDEDAAGQASEEWRCATATLIAQLRGLGMREQAIEQEVLQRNLKAISVGTRLSEVPASLIAQIKAWVAEMMSQPGEEERTRGGRP